MTPESILSYYPTYSILDEVTSTSGCKKLNIYLDLKNNLQSLYIKEVIYALIEESLNGLKIDHSIFISLLSFLSFHMRYARSRNIDINFYIFFETGVSYYHTNISKRYKINRKLDDLYGLEKERRDYFFTIVQKNLQLIESVFNKTPRTKVIRLENFEADFIPYFLIKNNYTTNENSSHIIYSNDHDLYQCLNLPVNNIYIYSKSGKHKKIIQKGEVIKSYLNLDRNIPDEYFTFIMSILGDSGDNVDKVSGVGPKRLQEIIDILIENTGSSIEEIRKKVTSDQPLFSLTSEQKENKYLKMIVDNETLIKNNMKLVDFDIISDYMLNPDSTSICEKRKKIDNIIKNDTITSAENMERALSMIGIEIAEDIRNLYEF